MSTPKWLDDLDFAAAVMPFGDLSVKITRHRSKTSKITITKESKLAPKDNIDAMKDLEKLINSLISVELTGNLEFALEFKKGTISNITIKNKEIKTYGEQRSS
jgi:hypothetical protein